MNYLTDCICDFEEASAPLCGIASMVHTFTFSLRFHFSFRVNIIHNKNKSRSEPGNAPRIVIGHKEVVCQK